MKEALVKLLIIIAVITSLFAAHSWQVNQAVQKAIATEASKYEKQKESLNSKSLLFECNIDKNAISIKGEKDAKIKDITSKYNAAIDSLRKHSTSDSSTSISPATCNAESTTGVTAERLFADHAEVSLGVAKDAEELKAHLNACYQQYDTVKEQLDNYRK